MVIRFQSCIVLLALTGCGGDGNIVGATATGATSRPSQDDVIQACAPYQSELDLAGLHAPDLIFHFQLNGPRPEDVGGQCQTSHFRFEARIGIIQSQDRRRNPLRSGCEDKIDTE